MDSSIFKQLLAESHFVPSNKRPIYLQLADRLLDMIKSGKLAAGQKMPSTRDLAALVEVNRITAGKAYTELQTQGWLESFVGRGTFISSHFEQGKPIALTNEVKVNKMITAGFSFKSQDYLQAVPALTNTRLHLDDGYPDPRLAPLKEFYRAYRSQLTRSGLYNKFGSYGDPAGSVHYRESLSKYLNETRGLQTTYKNILSVRGTLMGINLICNAFIAPGDIIVSGVPGWKRVEHNFLHFSAKHIGIPVDENGLVVKKLKEVCRKQKVKMVYVTPHHHYPTTVPLRLDRRLELLQLASEFGFIIVEDDYDFDFHYNHKPLLPLASADNSGMVIYCGSFSKSFSPAFRMGYLAASENVIEHLSKVRLFLDRQGDHISDNAMADLITDGTIQRYVRRTLPIYKKRRDFFCSLLKNELGNNVKFEIPEGGMTVWTEFVSDLKVDEIAQKAITKGLTISDGRTHIYSHYGSNSVRLGFASSTEEELQQAVEILRGILKH